MDIRRINKEFLDNIEEKLPTPLSDEQQKQLIIKVLQDDNKAKQELIENSIILVLKVVNEYKEELFYAKDLVSVGSLGLLKAVIFYSKDKKIEFTKYATNLIREEIQSFISKIAC